MFKTAGVCKNTEYLRRVIDFNIMSELHFECCVCNISLPVVYQGNNPPFLPGITYIMTVYFIFSFREEVFVMKQLSDETLPIPIGGICSECKKPCCLQPACSSLSSNDGYSFCIIVTNRKRYCKHHTH